jgi:hypothetical protein
MKVFLGIVGYLLASVLAAVIWLVVYKNNGIEMSIEAITLVGFAGLFWPVWLICGCVAVPVLLIGKLAALVLGLF